jgi:kynurenine formamidase
LAEATDNRSAGKSLGINEMLIRGWRKKKADLLKLPKGRKMARPGKEAHWPELEMKFHKWILEKRLKGIGISGTISRI